MRGAKPAENIPLNIGGVEGMYRRIALGKITRQTILSRNVNMCQS
jgi:hypothetical protein